MRYAYEKHCNRYVKVHLFLRGCDITTHSVHHNPKRNFSPHTHTHKKENGRAFHNVVLIRSSQTGFVTPTITTTTIKSLGNSQS